MGGELTCALLVLVILGQKIHVQCVNCAYSGLYSLKHSKEPTMMLFPKTGLNMEY